MENQIRLLSPAKINWLLRVGPLRSDGYHEICSVMQTLALADELTVTRRPDDECRLSGFPPDIDPDRNLVYLAWLAIRKAFPDQVHGVDISINKLLPRGGGLGGGSSNAATVIEAIRRIYLGSAPQPSMRDQLMSIAANVGSDVPFFLPGGTAIVRGRGDQVHIVPPAPIYHLVLLFPGEGTSTPEAYRQLDEQQRNIQLPCSRELDDFLTTLSSGDAPRLASAVTNDFELVSARYEWFTRARDQLEAAGALRAILCGSGSTVAGLCSDLETALKVASKTGGTYTCTVTAPVGND